MTTTIDQTTQALLDAIRVRRSFALNHQGVSRMPEWEDLISVGVAAHNAHLVAASLGLGAKWTSGAVVTHPLVAQLLGLAPPARLLGFLYVGRPAVAWPQGARRPLE